MRKAHFIAPVMSTRLAVLAERVSRACVKPLGYSGVKTAALNHISACIPLRPGGEEKSCPIASSISLIFRLKLKNE
jgi:hypothetical protein